VFAFIASIFGYLLNFLYNIFNNYGLAIIIFSVLVKLLLLPLTIKQQKTMDKQGKLQEEMKSLQFKYKNNPEQLNKEMMEMYKRENLSPFSGCLSSIAQLILILAVFYMVRSPLTYMRKVDPQVINDYTAKLEQKTNYPEVQIVKEFGSDDEKVSLNMNFLGLDLSTVPNSNYKDFKSFIIPFLYVVSSIVSMKMTLNMQKKDKVSENADGEEKEESPEDMMQSTNKTMSYMMPVMAFSISLVAPLGLALYWLMSNILMILERVFLNKLKQKEEENA
jgi:YidC/Oxa1 family membrane protein insertase